MQDPQTATSFFLGPVAAAYLTACALWLAYDCRWNLAASERGLTPSDHPYWDLLLVFAAAAGVFSLGAVYREGCLLPAGNSALGRVGWLVDNVIIYSPLGIVLAIRKQGPQTVFLSLARWPEKVALGLVLGLVAIFVYSGLRGELNEVPDYLVSAVQIDKLVDLLPVFFEGVAVVFAFVRLRWALGTAAAIAIPSLLFAAAHVPGQFAEGRDTAYMAVFFVFNAGLATAIFSVVQRSRDVIWLGLVHYLMDIAIRAI